MLLLTALSADSAILWADACDTAESASCAVARRVPTTPGGYAPGRPSEMATVTHQSDGQGEAPRRSAGRTLPRRLARLALLIVMTVSVLLGARAVLSASAGTAVEPWPVRPDPRARILPGVTTEPIASNSFRPWGGKELESVNRFEQQARKHMGVVAWYADWAHVKRPSLYQLRAVQARGSLPEITWEPWDSVSAARGNQPRYRLARIIAGDFDGYVRRWARGLRAYGGPVRLRFAHEMNGRFYPWAVGVNGNTARQYVQAWRHVHRIFAQERATNVTWVWSAAATRLSRPQYPGREQVDEVGLSGYVGGSQLRQHPWRPFTAVFGPSLRRLGVIAPGKPIEISEVGAAEQGGDKAEWIRGMFAALARERRVDAFVWFDIDQASDWRVGTSAAARRAFARGVAPPRFGQRTRRPPALGAAK